MNAADRGLMRCVDCGQLNAGAGNSSRSACARCGSELHAREPHSLARCWGLLIAAYALYVPANLLPVLLSSQLGVFRSDTILSGVVQLVHDGAWPLAFIIVVASIGVPLAKLLILTWLLASVQAGSLLHRVQRTRAARLLEVIGRWSMIDIYVGGLLVGLVRFEPFANVGPGPGAIAFGAVVVLTMMASRAFDPRLIWDARESAQPHGGLQPALRPDGAHG